MATRNRRNEWHQVHGRWTRSLGERGMRVRIFEKRRNGTFYRTTWVPGQQSEYPARRRGTSKVAARVLWRALRRANADRSRSIGVRREPQGWWRRPRRWYQD